MGGSRGSAEAISSLGYGFATLIALATAIALVVLALAVVRKTRPDASGYLAAAGGLQIFVVIVRSISYAIVPTVLSRTSGIEGMLTFNAAMAVGWALVGMVETFLLFTGIYRLSKPPKGEGPEYPPYR